MKKFRKIAALAFALVLMFSLCSAVFAAEPDEVASAATPPSSAAILSSKTLEVGFMSLV